METIASFRPVYASLNIRNAIMLTYSETRFRLTNAQKKTQSLKFSAPSHKGYPICETRRKNAHHGDTSNPRNVVTTSRKLRVVRIKNYINVCAHCTFYTFMTHVLHIARVSLRRDGDSDTFFFFLVVG